MTRAEQPSDSARFAGRLGVLGLVLLANAIALSVPPLEMPTTCECDQRLPILCAELPPSAADLACVLDDSANTRPEWRQQVLLDLPFLVLYGLMIAGAGWRESGWRESESRESEGRHVRIAIAVFAALGAALDACENFGILHALSQLDGGLTPSDGLATWVRLCATAKFTSLSLACVLACAGALRRGASWPTRIGLGVPLALSAVGLASPLSSVAIDVAGLGIAATCLALWVRAVHAWRAAA